MKSLTEHLWFETLHRRDYINITDTVEQLVRKSGGQEGFCLVNAMHITNFMAFVVQNEASQSIGSGVKSCSSPRPGVEKAMFIRG
jgi:thiamine phosphate synthase YjbQ (UPF0047 family)